MVTHNIKKNKTLFTYQGTASLPFSTYNSFLLSINTPRPDTGRTFLVYKPGVVLPGSTFTNFTAGTGYEVNCKDDFIISSDSPEYSLSYNIYLYKGSGNNIGQNIVTFRKDVRASIPISAYGSDFLSNLNAVFRVNSNTYPYNNYEVYKPGLSNRFFTTFDPGSSYLVQVKGSYILGTYSLPITPTPTQTRTPTITPTVTVTLTPTKTPTCTPTPSPTRGNIVVITKVNLPANKIWKQILIPPLNFLNALLFPDEINPKAYASYDGCTTWYPCPQSFAPDGNYEVSFSPLLNAFIGIYPLRSYPQKLITSFNTYDAGYNWVTNSIPAGPCYPSCTFNSPICTGESKIAVYDYASGVIAETSNRGSSWNVYTNQSGGKSSQSFCGFSFNEWTATPEFIFNNLLIRSSSFLNYTAENSALLAIPPEAGPFTPNTFQYIRGLNEGNGNWLGFWHGYCRGGTCYHLFIKVGNTWILKKHLAGGGNVKKCVSGKDIYGNNVYVIHATRNYNPWINNPSSKPSWQSIQGPTYTKDFNTFYPLNIPDSGLGGGPGGGFTTITDIAFHTGTNKFIVIGHAGGDWEPPIPSNFCFHISIE